jgi:hypothetical protein
MGRRGLGLVVMVSAVVVLFGTTTAVGAPSPPAISFAVTPQFVGCYSGQRPVLALASWRIVHRVRSASISGAVDAGGKSLPPVSIPTMRTRQGVVGDMKLRLRCSATAQTLTLTAIGPGGTTTSVATLNENRAD